EETRFVYRAARLDISAVPGGDPCPKRSERLSLVQPALRASMGSADALDPLAYIAHIHPIRFGMTATLHGFCLPSDDACALTRLLRAFSASIASFIGRCAVWVCMFCVSAAVLPIWAR